MDLRMRESITRPKVSEIPITDVVINDVEKLGGIKDLRNYKFIIEKINIVFTLMSIWKE